jgi:hypothetical protein
MALRGNKSRTIRRIAAAILVVLLASSSTLSSISARSSSNATATTKGGTPFPVDGSDSFESGSLADWTAQGVKVQQKHVSGGSYAVRATADRTPAFLNRPLAKSQTELVVQLSIAVLAQDDNWLSLLQLRTPDGNSIIMVFSDKNGNLGFQLGDGGPIFTSDVAVGDGGWHELNVHLRVGKAGAVEISLDGDAIPALSGPHSIASGPIGDIELGSVSPRHTFDALFDSVSIKKAAKAGVRSAKAIATPAAASVARLDDPVLQWLPEITAAANATFVPPSLIAGVIALESSGNPYTVSVAGAIGLMQVMPDELAAHGVGYNAGFDPAINVMTGSRILAERSGAGWELAAGYYFGIGCDAYNTCTADYVRAVLAWAAYYAPALNDPFRGNPGVIPASWEISPDTSTAAPTPSVTSSKTPTPTKTPAATKTPTPRPNPTKTPTAAPTETTAPKATPTPTEAPTDTPTEAPTETPTEVPTDVPTAIPTDVPTDVPAPPSDSSPPAG